MPRYGGLLTDAPWEAIRPLLPKRPRPPRGGRPRAADRKVQEGILWILRSAARGNQAVGHDDRAVFYRRTCHQHNPRADDSLGRRRVLRLRRRCHQQRHAQRRHTQDSAKTSHLLLLFRSLSLAEE